MEQDIFNSSFFTMVALTVCEPSSIGFNMADLEVMSQLPEVCVPLLKAVVSTPYKTQLESGIRKTITVQRSVFHAFWTECICFIVSLLVQLCVFTVFVFPASLEELCAVDLYEADTRDSHANMHLLLSACKQLHQSELLDSVLHTQVPTDQILYDIHVQLE